MHDLSVLGYDSDDEYDDDEPHYTRRNHGKKYSQLAKEDSQEYTMSHNQLYDSSQLRVDSVSMYGDSNSYTFTQDSHSERRNSESLPSSEDFNSDSEIATKHIYVQRKEGGLHFFTSILYLALLDILCLAL